MKSILLIIGSGFALYAVILMVFYFFQGRMLFFPGTGVFGNCPEMEKNNAVAVSIENIRYYVQARPDPVSWIVIFHGNAGSGCDRIYFFDLLASLNSNIVVFEYPGYGGDANAPGEKKILDHALELIHHLKETDQKALPVYLLGESIGTGVATWVAGRTDIKGLILISPYTSIAGVARFHYPWLPVKWLMKHKFPADAWAGKIRTPVLLFHGKEDDIIPIQFARQQFNHFKGEKELVEIPGCGHNDLIDAGNDMLREKIRTFLEKTLK